MMYFAPWKKVTILVVCLLGVILSLPNILPRSTLDALPSWVPARQINLGLDLRGGSYLLLEVDMKAVIDGRLSNIQDSIRSLLRRENITYSDLAVKDHSVNFTLADPSQADRVRTLLAENLATGAVDPLAGGQRDLDISVGSDGKASLTLTEVGLRDREARAVEQSIEIVRRRVDESGTREPLISRQGSSRILLQLPGEQNPDRIRRLLGQTAKMTFHLVNLDYQPGQLVPPDTEVLPIENPRPGERTSIAVRKRIEVDGANLTDARAGTNSQNGQWVVNFEFDSAGARRFGQVTQANVNKPFAIVLDDKVITYPNINEPILGGRGQISGNFTAQSANDLAVLLRAGALPAPLTIVEERTVGPDLGADAIQAGIIAVAVGFLLVITYMTAAYGLFGIFANIALVMNLVITLAVLSLLEATLTLPGIAGLLLTLGLSVDANILINERLHEETKRGRSPFSAMDAGFSRAFSTIFDANITSLIKMAILYTLSTGPVRGFAVTTAIGILTSMFTAIVLVRLMMVSWIRRKRPTVLPVLRKA
ncbi:protein translocase subunit SecD [Inquilinus sp.]|uniref:protein translocase subunit SecD n=1 Tax=Inquilinus sp. TaxID=1932117 RepID=UPI0031D28515